MKVSELFENKNEPTWYIVRVKDDAICAGPFSSRREASSKTDQYAWYRKDPSAYSIEHGEMDEDFDGGYDKFKDVKRVTEAKVRTEKAADASARYEKFKKMLAAGVAGVTQQQVDNIKKIADSLWDTEMNAKEKHLVDTHGAEWWELVKKQYPISEEGGEFVVKSKFAIDPDAGKRGPWKFASNGEARDKVQKLIGWLNDGRKRGFGDKDADIQKWIARLDAVDKAKS
jgi:hypothetical protein